MALRKQCSFRRQQSITLRRLDATEVDLLRVAGDEHTVRANIGMVSSGAHHLDPDVALEREHLAGVLVRAHHHASFADTNGGGSTTDAHPVVVGEVEDGILLVDRPEIAVGTDGNLSKLTGQLLPPTLAPEEGGLLLGQHYDVMGIGHAELGDLAGKVHHYSSEGQGTLSRGFGCNCGLDSWNDQPQSSASEDRTSIKPYLQAIPR